MDILNILLENLHGHIYLKDLKGTYIWCNKRQFEFNGFNSLEEIKGKTDFDFFPKHIASKLWEADSRIMRTGLAELLEEEAEIDGKLMVVVSYKAPIIKNGEVIGLIGNSLDISTQRLLQRELEKENNKNRIALENIVTHLPAHIYWKDKLER